MILVDHGSIDETGREAQQAGARVVRLESFGNPGAARNRGAEVANGHALVVLDADCLPARGWLAARLAAHDAGEACVGGSIALPHGLPATARWDYYFSSYYVHRMPVAHGHGELAWQAALGRAGGRLLRRSYRWGYSAIQAKAESGTARWNWLYRYPGLLVAASLLTAPAQAVYIARCWLRVRNFEPVFAFPALLLGRVVYAAGMALGGWRSLVSDWRPTSVAAPEPR